jgi:hypothetical protein
MKAIRVSECGGPSVLKLEVVPTPQPGPNQVLVRNHAVGINPVDTHLRSNTDNRGPKLPYTPGADAAGPLSTRRPRSNAPSKSQLRGPVRMLVAIAKVHRQNGFSINWSSEPGKGRGFEMNSALISGLVPAGRMLDAGSM